MKVRLRACVALALSIAAPAAAQSNPELGQRCSADLLTNAAAEARLSWARRCALLTRVGNPAAWMDTGVASSNGAGTLKDYQEFNPATNFWGQNSYVGQTYAFEVNSMVVNNLYLHGPIAQTTDANGYYAWQQPVSRKRGRPLYPIYGSHADIGAAGSVQLFAHPSNTNDCSLYLDKNGTNRAIRYSFYVNAYCEAQVAVTCNSCHLQMGAAPVADGKAGGELLHDVDLKSWPAYQATMQLVGDELMRGDDIGLYNRMTIYKSIPPELIPGEEGAQ